MNETATAGNTSERRELSDSVRAMIQEGKGDKGEFGRMCNIFDNYIAHMLSKYEQEDQETAINALKDLGSSYDSVNGNGAGYPRRADTIGIDLTIALSIHLPERLGEVQKALVGKNGESWHGIGMYNILDVAYHYGIPMSCLPPQVERIVAFGTPWHSKGDRLDRFGQLYTNVAKGSPDALLKLQEFMIDHGIRLRERPDEVAKHLGLESYLPGPRAI